MTQQKETKTLQRHDIPQAMEALRAQQSINNQTPTVAPVAAKELQKQLCPKCQSATDSLKTKFPKFLTGPQQAAFIHTSEVAILLNCKVCNRENAYPIMSHPDH